MELPRKEEENKIDVRESWDINFWCEELNLRAEELKEIVKIVGPQVHDVRLHIAKKLMLSWPKAY
jgi:hypothetical protein